MRAAGEISVELVDCQSGDAVPGFTFADCDPDPRRRPGPSGELGGRSDLSAIVGTARRQPRVGRGLQIRVRLRGDARLYGTGLLR